MTCQAFRKDFLALDLFMKLTGMIAFTSLVRSGELLRREYHTANNETIIRIPSGNSRIVFIYVSLALSTTLL
jgi:hypothetical protein